MLPASPHSNNTPFLHPFSKGYLWTGGPGFCQNVPGAAEAAGAAAAGAAAIVFTTTYVVVATMAATEAAAAPAAAAASIYQQLQLIG